LDSQSPEQGEIGFHLAELFSGGVRRGRQRHGEYGIPIGIGERIPDHLLIGGADSPVAGQSTVQLERSPRKWAKDAVIGVNELLIQRAGQGEHLLAQLGKGASLERHHHVAYRWGNSLGSQAGVGDGDELLDQCCAVVDPDAGVLIQRAEWVYTVEEVVGPTVPEIAVVEDGVDH